METYKEMKSGNLNESNEYINNLKALYSDVDYYGRFILVGEDEIKKAIEKYNLRWYDYGWTFAATKVSGLKIKGTAVWVYAAIIGITIEQGCVSLELERLEKAISYKGYLFNACQKYGDKNYTLSLLTIHRLKWFNVEIDKPQKVGVLTDKKADSWLAALLEELTQSELHQTEIDCKKKQFMKKMSQITKRPEDTFEKSGRLDAGVLSIEWDFDDDGNPYTTIDLNHRFSTDKLLEKLAKCGLLD